MTKKEREERAAIRLTTIKRLFARSLNRCAFPGCSSMIVDDESDTMIGEMCHIEGIGKKALRHNKTLTREQRDAYDNLILLCSNHHAIIDHDDKTYTVEVLRRMKAEHEKTGRFDLQSKDERFAKICIASMTIKKTMSTSSRTYNAPHYESKGQSRMNVFNTTIINQKHSAKRQYPSDSIGSDTNKANYISYLIEKYHKCKEWEIGKENMEYSIFPNRIKAHFKIGRNRTFNHIPVFRFDEVVTFITDNIRRTKLFIVGGMGFKSYNDWLREQMGA